MASTAETFLAQKLRETLSECGVPALAAAMVRKRGGEMLAAQEGVRNAQGSGPANKIQPEDTFNIGSVSKVFSGHLIGVLIGKGLHADRLSWNTTIEQIFPEVFNKPGAVGSYRHVMIKDLHAHTSGMPYQPSTDHEPDWQEPSLAELNPQFTVKRRKLYVQRAVMDPLQYPPAAGTEYSGGQVITIAMAEKITGQTYNDLMRAHIYTPLGMGTAGAGRTQGTWWHRWEAGQSSPVVADAKWNSIKLDYHARHPVGGVVCSALDMAKFMREQLVDTPKTCSRAARNTMHQTQVRPQSDHVLSCWGSTRPGSLDTQLYHVGATEASYAAVQVELAEGVGFASMSNMHGTLASAAVGTMLLVMRTMESQWGTLFGPQAKAPIESVHPSPALVWSKPAQGAGSFMSFGRQFDGKVVIATSPDAVHWAKAGDFGDAALNSGVAAATTGNGQHTYVCGRGLNQHMWYASKTIFSGGKWEGWHDIGGEFITGASVAVNWDGSRVAIVGIGTNRQMFISFKSAGEPFDGWSAIGSGVFNAAPAIAMSDDGQRVIVVGRGLDFRYWYNLSTDGGRSFRPHWAPIGDGVFTSGPAVAMSHDGRAIRIAGRGTDCAIWYNTSLDWGGTWAPHWKQLCKPGTPAGQGESPFLSTPTITIDRATPTMVVGAIDRSHHLATVRCHGWEHDWGDWVHTGTHLLV